MSKPMDTITVNELRVDTVVGIWDWERQITQKVSIDLELAADVRRAAESDSIDATLDYRAVAKRVSGFVADSRYQLIEAMARAFTPGGVDSTVGNDMPQSGTVHQDLYRAQHRVLAVGGALCASWITQKQQSAEDYPG